MRTPVIKKEQVEQQDENEARRDWYVIDAANIPLGRLASKVAFMLRGKHKPTFTPHVDMGDFVIVINAGKVKLTGNKLTQKFYFTHSQWPGGDKRVIAKHMLERKPTEVTRLAVKGMLPKNRLGRQMLKKLKVYAGDEHPHQAQQPQALSM